MKIVIAPDSFKECLDAMDVASEIEAGFKVIFPDAEYVKLPMADGGEGTVESMVSATNGQMHYATVKGPLGEPVQGFYGILGEGETAVIEMAAASGIHLIEPSARNPLKASTYGTGQLIIDALNQGVKNIIIGIGGSATNDGGAGMMHALGAQLLDKNGNEIQAGGAALADVAKINLETLDSRLKSVSITAACDVNNPLCGDNGASAIFGPQKGATPEMVKQLDAALFHYGSVIEALVKRPVMAIPGVGAAGGMGIALLGLLNATLKPGIEIVIDALHLEDIVKDADLVITGEGKTDSQTIKGKTPMGVAKAAKMYNKPVIVISGSLSTDSQVVLDHGIDATFSTVYRIQTLNEALSEARANLRQIARNIAAVYALGQKA